jgi:hypothetical protein
LLDAQLGTEIDRQLVGWFARFWKFVGAHDRANP